MRKIIAALGILACVSIPAAASNEWSYTDVFDYNKGILKIEGQASPDTVVTINIPAFEKTVEDLNGADNAGDLIVHSNDTKTDKDGNFCFQVEFDQSLTEGEYKVYIGSSSFEAAKILSFYFTNAQSYAEIISSLGNAQDIEDNAEKIGLDGDLYDAVADKAAVYDMIAKYNINKGLSQTDSLKNKRVFESAVVTQAIKENKQLPQGWINNILPEEDEIAADYKKYISSNEPYFLEMLKTPASVEELEDNILDSLVLTLVKFSDGVGNIKTVFEKYNARLGTGANKPNTQDADLQDYSYIAGKTYNDIDSCIKEFNERVNAPASGPSQGGSSSGGGGGRGIYEVMPGSSQTPPVLSVGFEDLNSVPWAYQAISTLYSKGIVNGKNEKEFYPNDTIKREEFIKLLVSMANMDNERYEENSFLDVDDNAWYANYVNIAYKKNICSGIGERNFGVGMEISREDMCVMVYSLLRVLGIACEEGEISFADADDFYGYSKTAVYALNAAGIVNGVGNNLFNPKGKATRAQAAVVIYNVLQRING